MIHPTAVVDPHAELGDNVHVGPYAVIEGQVEIGHGCRIGAHAVIHAYVRMAAGNAVHPHAVLGGLPQDLSFDPEEPTFVEIGESNVFREGVTISRATATGGATRIGSNNYLMNNTHVGHDCSIGDHNVLASGATLGGHVHVGDRVFFGGGVMVHQFCRVGSYAILQGLAGINKDVIPYTLVGGRPGKHYRLNLIGLRRAGIDGERSRAISAAFRRLRARQGLDGLPDTPETTYLREWLTEESKRGYLGFFERRDPGAA
ncbi:MAG: acyl-ACP--UDP-N-acetylglucosamine O-acyltransferase [Methylotetracoccus sp.]|nr:acyl-ACP--UDP-N-acetylglucosamine O-acyltransferase [Methylotetracoccus sp.]